MFYAPAEVHEQRAELAHAALLAALGSAAAIHIADGRSGSGWLTA